MQFICLTEIQAPPDAVFDLKLSVDAHLDSMRRSRERVVAGVTNGQIALGDSVTWRAWHLGLRWTMTSRVTELDRPARFVDEQVRGPFRRFRHEHVFEPLNGSTQMTDILTFDAPLGVVGRVTGRLVLLPYLRRLIQQRNHHLKRLLEAP